MRLLFLVDSDSGPSVFTAERDEKIGWMNIGGEDVPLTLVWAEGIANASGVGNRLCRIYKFSTITVHAEYLVTEVCESGDEGCEVTHMDGTFQVAQGNSKELVNVRGECGC